MHELQTQHGWYAGDHIKTFIASLGPFFQKYIERGLARIDAELNTTRSLPQPAATMSVHEYKERLTQLRSQMFGVSASSVTDHHHDDNTDNSNVNGQEGGGGSPVRNRLDSPAYKFARMATTGSTQNSPLSPGRRVVDHQLQDATITSLRERLARLKNNDQQ